MDRDFYMLGWILISICWRDRDFSVVRVDRDFYMLGDGSRFLYIAGGS